MSRSYSWRSMLFVPANNPKLIQSAIKRGADAIILDLEDSVIPSSKASARESLQESVDCVAAAGIDVVIRVNSSLKDMVKDIAAADLSQVTAILVPKCDDSFRVKAAAELIESYRNDYELSPVIIALIESPIGILNLNEIAQASPLLKGLLLGSEDYCAALETAPSEAVLTLPATQVAIAAAAHNLHALGLVGSLADYSDLDLFAARVRASRAVGLKGAALIHPSQVAPTNLGFSPSSDEVELAVRMVLEFEQAKLEGKGAIAVDGKMIDEPVYQRALRLANAKR
jgi:citrate lyase subunit beta / citryl-CoA lyase